jgi:agmatine deiminase
MTTTTMTTILKTSARRARRSRTPKGLGRLLRRAFTAWAHHSRSPWLRPFSLSALFVAAVATSGCLEGPPGRSAGARASSVTAAPRPSGSALTSNGQRSYTIMGKKAPLPAWETAWEQDLARQARLASPKGLPAGASTVYDTYRANHASRFYLTQPPSTTVRAPAEYEESQGYLVQWIDYGTQWNTLFAQMVKGAWGVVPVILAVDGSSTQSSIETALAKVGIASADFKDTSKVVWWTHPVSSSVSSIWARDFGPVGINDVVTTGTPTLSFVDFRYYYMRVYDDEIPTALALDLGVDVFRPDLDFEGGNFMSTSDGLCAATKGVLWHNPQLSQSAVEKIFADYLGCTKSVFPTPLKGEGTTHIDMFSKLASDTAVIVGEYTASQDSANKTILDADAQLFSSTTNGSGGAITVTRIPMPDKGSQYGQTVWRTYTNSLSLKGASSKVLLIPVYSDETTYQSSAMSVYSSVFSGWTQVKIDSQIIIPSGGAMHCITMQIPAGTQAKMESDPADLCGLTRWTCVYRGCGNITSTGCCESDILKYCSGSGKLAAGDCSSNPSCGWDSSKSLYSCGTSGTAESSGTYPMSCGVLTDAALPDAVFKNDSSAAADCGLVAYQGCCDGNTLWFCDPAKGLLSSNCAFEPSCGWDKLKGFYDCGTSGNADPAGAYPLSCAGLFGDGGPAKSDVLHETAPSGDSATDPCGTLSSVGCCDGDTLQYCAGGKLQLLSCAKNPKCGWDSKNGWYDCGTSGESDPSGTSSKVCSGSYDLGVREASPSKDRGAPESVASLEGGSLDGRHGSEGKEPAAVDRGCSCSIGSDRTEGVPSSTGPLAPLLLVLGLAVRLRGNRRRPG